MSYCCLSSFLLLAIVTVVSSHQPQQFPGSEQKVPSHAHNVNSPPAGQANATPPPPAGGTPAGHGHGHGKEHGSHLRDKSHTQNQQHIKEHLDGVVNTEDMSQEQLQFHYFKLHDYDNNNKLDGIELTSAVTHFHEENGEIHELLSDEDIAEWMDESLELEDLNNDGFISYLEFRKASEIAALVSDDELDL